MIATNKNIQINLKTFAAIDKFLEKTSITYSIIVSNCLGAETAHLVEIQILNLSRMLIEMRFS